MFFCKSERVSLILSGKMIMSRTFCTYSIRKRFNSSCTTKTAGWDPGTVQGILNSGSLPRAEQGCGQAQDASLRRRSAKSKNAPDRDHDGEPSYCLTRPDRPMQQLATFVKRPDCLGIEQSGGALRL
jgi:hypothetical protein